MINWKCNCENEVNSWKLVILKKASSGKAQTLAKTCNCFQKSTAI